MPTHPNDLANPCNLEYTSYGEHGEPINSIKTSFGLTKREYMATHLMMGLISSWGQHDVTDFNELASDAVKATDALIDHLNNNQ